MSKHMSGTVNVWIVTHGDNCGSSDVAYFHGVFSSESEANQAAKEVSEEIRQPTQVTKVKLNVREVGDKENDYHGIPGLRLV